MGTKGDQSQLKKRQIDTLKIFNDNVKTIKEDELYSIDFKAGDKDVKIKISLLDFPNKKPMFVIEPLLDHPWLDSSGNVTASPGVLNVRSFVYFFVTHNFQICFVVFSLPHFHQTSDE